MGGGRVSHLHSCAACCRCRARSRKKRAAQSANALPVCRHGSGGKCETMRAAGAAPRQQGRRRVPPGSHVEHSWSAVATHCSRGDGAHRGRRRFSSAEFAGLLEADDIVTSWVLKRMLSGPADGQMFSDCDRLKPLGPQPHLGSLRRALGCERVRCFALEIALETASPLVAWGR